MRTPPNHDRRRFLSRVIGSIQAAIGGTVAFVVGGAINVPFQRHDDNWLAAGTLRELIPDAPTPVMLRVTRDDGYTQVVERRVVFLVKTGDARVTALSSTCTHLGCRVRWDAEGQVLRCPCHGGIYDRTGAVIAGPPPEPLPTLRTRIEGDQILVEV
jgi:menaquinol-cytochrome c reductase iron-sulfur subunit